MFNLHTSEYTCNYIFLG